MIKGFGVPMGRRPIVVSSTTTAFCDAVSCSNETGGAALSTGSLRRSAPGASLFLPAANRRPSCVAIGTPLRYLMQVNNEQERIKERIRSWERAEPVLEEARRNDTRSARTTEAFVILASLVSAAIRETSPRATSGLVEQQRWFKKIAAK